ncbi:MAG: orotidine 5'-phosphate decarboxylase [Candidatus Micrarchaeota archaeon]|nr:orotidine 5'-phosphate decarboxylase [Candidatus Micrarchaeota archaeon]MDE1824571.1 orotidine 5'-phosphate decarboxylase [Candidatus Micrarchaeota archaeon]MDE1849245.1 orotidine 5'-phosphate decarboxylase [Candidatus Micrarchaeota archaeon]
MGSVVKYKRSIVPAADFDTVRKLRKLVQETHDVKGIGAYKLGAELAVGHGLKKLVETVREFTGIPIVYDHQKGMTDIPDTGEGFLTMVKESGVDAFIGFPLSGPATQEEWIRQAQDIGLKIIMGGEMTHPKFKSSEGGYIADDKLDEMYLLSARLGVLDFVVPGNRKERVAHYHEILEPIVGDELTFWAPGFVAQGGVLSDAAKAAGDSFHAIVGRGIYAAKDMRKAAEEMAAQLPGE